MPWMTAVGAAAAAGDYDRDGRIDLYLTTSLQGHPNRLFRNRGDGTFVEVGELAGLAAVNDERGVSVDAIWGDVDDDGWPDLYLVRWGQDSLFRNRGDGTFEDVTDRLFHRRDGRPGIDWANGSSAVFLDFDRDGRLDVYVGNYFRDHDLWRLDTTRIMHDSFERARNGGPNFLFHQRPDGTFEEVAARLGVEDPGWTLAVGSADVDGDGWPDLYCADDFGPDQLFLGDGSGGFVDVSASALGTDSKKGMNVDFGDFDGDGWLDLFVTNITEPEYLSEGNMLWHNGGPGPDGRLTFTDVSLESGTYDSGWGWGAKFFDYDLDADLDLVVGTGFITAGPQEFWHDLASWTVSGDEVADAARWPAIGDRSFSGNEPSRLWRNDGGGFTDQAKNEGLVSRRDNRGCAVFDFDDDGDLDVYFANQGQPGELFVNGGAQGNHWLGLRLVPDPATGVVRDGIGTRVRIAAGGRVQTRERDGGNGFAAQSDPRPHFGLGARDRVELVEIRWPDGGIQVLEDIAGDRYLTVHQDRSAYLPAPRIAVTPPRPPAGRPAHSDEPTGPVADPRAVEAKLAALEAKLAQSPLVHGVAVAYRREAVAAGDPERAVNFFTRLAEHRPADPAVHFEAGLALLDGIPACGGSDKAVCKGTLAGRSLERFDEVVRLEPDSWEGHFARGMNHLHWARGLRHADDAARDLARALELAAAGKGPPVPSLEETTWVALGDAWSRDRDPARARDVWRKGLAAFPESPELTRRLAFTDDAALDAFVEARRSHEAEIRTDYSFLDLPRAGARDTRGSRRSGLSR